MHSGLSWWCLDASVNVSCGRGADPLRHAFVYRTRVFDEIWHANGSHAQSVLKLLKRADAASAWPQQQADPVHATEHSSIATVRLHAYVQQAERCFTYTRVCRL